jgi:hypothetical protein
LLVDQHPTLSKLRATLLVISMKPYKLKLDEEKATQHTSLAQQNGFGPVFMLSLLRLVKGTTKKRLINMI